MIHDVGCLIRGAVTALAGAVGCVARTLRARAGTVQAASSLGKRHLMQGASGALTVAANFRGGVAVLGQVGAELLPGGVRSANTPRACLVRVANLTTLIVLLTPFAAIAQDFDYDPRRSAELRECDEPRERGRVNQARDCYAHLALTSTDPLIRAEAAWGLGDIRQANELFRAATQADERSGLARARWGRLFLATHQHADALAMFREALEIDSKDIHARLGTARVFAERFEGQAKTLVAELLKENDQLIEAHLLSARMDLEDGRLQTAERSLDRAVALAERQKRAPLEAFALYAALDLMRGDETAARWTKRALDYNPRYGGVFETLAHYEVMRRRYREASTWLSRAVEVQPDLWSAHAELGVNLLRLGEIDAGRKHLEQAYKGDPYSATTVNTLRLLDDLKEFKVDQTASPAILTRLHQKEADALRPYVHDLMRSSIQTFSRRYGFQPAQPVIVELYPDHDDFAVRTAGLPGIGLLGVTFGYLVAMDSPSGRPPGEFHWGSTLWHEVAHVFTLSLTDHRVPRWLSEGISVFEEWRTGPTPGVSVSPSALAAFRDGRFLPVATLDEGFIRPKYPDQIQVSYLQSGLICLFIEQRFGFDRLVALLRQFTKDTTTAAAIEATFKMPPREFDRQFNSFIQERFTGMLTRHEEWQRHMTAAHTAAESNNWAAVIDPAREAVEIFPEYTTSDSAHLLLARAYDGTGRRNEAISALRRYRELGGWDPVALRQLSQWLEESGRKDEATGILSALNYVDPLNGAHHANLGERYLTGGKPVDALREFRVLLALDPLDKAVANFGIARALRSQGDLANSRRHLLDALETAPHYRPAQDLLLEMVGDRAQ